MALDATKLPTHAEHRSPRLSIDLLLLGRLALLADSLVGHHLHRDAVRVGQQVLLDQQVIQVMMVPMVLQEQQVIQEMLEPQEQVVQQVTQETQELMVLKVMQVIQETQEIQVV